MNDTTQPCRHTGCPVCGEPIPGIAVVAHMYDFTYDEALAYVITVGLAYTHRPPHTAMEPGE